MAHAKLGDSLVPRFLDLVAAAGRPGCEVATRLDLLIAIGPAYAWRRLRDETAHARLDQGGRNRVYRDIWLHAATEVGAELEELGRGWFEIRAAAAGADPCSTPRVAAGHRATGARHGLPPALP